tara:strand:+ start:14271 stop:14537 length:267 start_codon:yes stop_codon:yes gene_type:complete
MILNIILILLILLLSFVVFKQDKTIAKQIDYIDTVEIKMLTNLQSTKDTLTKMNEIDDKGGFQSDDEVGQIFTNIKEAITTLEKDINE